jgi:GNAT superfamily N-acetyltransferase
VESAIGIRTYQGAEDIPRWLEIRRRSLHGQIAPARPWSEADFRREFLEKPWWRPDWMWFAEEPGSAGAVIPLGAAALRTMESETPAAGSIQWLLVLPEHRRRGVGRQLIRHLEAAAWDFGCRTVIAETLASWQDAVRFYERLGYRRDG